MYLDMRTIVNLDDEVVAVLDEHCRRVRISRSEAVRRAIAGYLREVRPGGEDAFGLWSDRTADGLEYEDRVRGEWGDRAGGD